MNLHNEHEILLKLLDEIQRILEDNNIPYFLIGGSAIGAVRNGGIIPWDDDIDIGIQREYFTGAVQALKQNCQSKIYIPSSKGEYILPFAKVVKKIPGEEVIDSETNINGAYIDLFPLDHTSNSEFGRLIHYFLFKLGHKIVVSKIKPEFLNNNLIDKLIYLTTSKLSIPIIFKLRDYYIKFGASVFGESNTFFNFGSPYGLDKEIYYKNEILKTQSMDFSGRKVPIATGYDRILRRTYGNYMVTPPKGRQHQKHLSEENKDDIL
ncbi:LicD family protein [Lentilactobacillus hilgardii]|uniref:LicD family protein n=1 Tax=Lentilactobacillus hilgardii TaxID=1588 RepID=UPI0021A748A4|nr:LicD family protein [Lentilactobacillus hilgardii]MCT3393067.1 hypothetical protein [Lentilactobacillus hilgardii]